MAKATSRGSWFTIAWRSGLRSFCCMTGKRKTYMTQSCFHEGAATGPTPPPAASRKRRKRLAKAQPKKRKQRSLQPHGFSSGIGLIQPNNANTQPPQVLPSLANLQQCPAPSLANSQLSTGFAQEEGTNTLDRQASIAATLCTAAGESPSSRCFISPVRFFKFEGPTIAAASMHTD